MQVEVRLYAIARERAGRPSVVLDLPEGSRLADLKSALVRSLPELTGLVPHFKFAIDQEYAEDGDMIASGSEVVVVPPVSGG